MHTLFKGLSVQIVHSSAILLSILMAQELLTNKRDNRQEQDRQIATIQIAAIQGRRSLGTKVASTSITGKQKCKQAILKCSSNYRLYTGSTPQVD